MKKLYIARENQYNNFVLDTLNTFDLDLAKRFALNTAEYSRDQRKRTSTATIDIYNLADIGEDDPRSADEIVRDLWDNGIDFSEDGDEQITVTAYTYTYVCVEITVEDKHAAAVNEWWECEAQNDPDPDFYVSRRYTSERFDPAAIDITAVGIPSKAVNPIYADFDGELVIVYAIPEDEGFYDLAHRRWEP